MSRADVTYLIAGVCGVVGAAAFVGMILAPAITAYAGVWQRLVAAALSFYVLAAMVVIGVFGAWGVYQLWISYG